jgi:hypothetical protein
MPWLAPVTTAILGPSDMCWLLPDGPGVMDSQIAFVGLIVAEYLAMRAGIPVRRGPFPRTQA